MKTGAKLLLFHEIRNNRLRNIEEKATKRGKAEKLSIAVSA